MAEIKTLRQALEFAVQAEELGGLLYDELKAMFEKEPEIAEIFSVLAKDERVHQAQFKKLLEGVPAADAAPVNPAMKFVNLMAQSPFFFDKDGLFRQLEKIKTREDALQRSFNLEKDTAAFYDSLRDVLGDSAELGEIIAAEKRHMLKLGEYLITGAKMRGTEDTF